LEVCTPEGAQFVLPRKGDQMILSMIGTGGLVHFSGHTTELTFN
jgi:hypothetical protein